MLQFSLFFIILQTNMRMAKEFWLCLFILIVLVWGRCCSCLMSQIRSFLPFPWRRTFLFISFLRNNNPLGILFYWVPFIQLENEVEGWNGNLSVLLFEMKSGNHPSQSLCVTKIHWAIKIKVYFNEIVSQRGKVRNTCQPNRFLKNLI